MKSLPHKFGLLLGSMSGLIHLAWSLLVAFGWAQAWTASVQRMHFVQLSVTFLPFSFVRAASLVALTFLSAYALGYIAGLFWQKIEK